MAEILLFGGEVALVDDCDFQRASRFSWFLTSGPILYAQRKQGRKNILLHREIMDAPAGLYVDHINGNGLDNRRENLRLCTAKENIWNQRRRTKNTSGFKGVNKSGGMWRARIKVNNQEIPLGCYEDATEAARAYDYAAKKYFGEFARTNFPEINPPAKLLRMEARKALRGNLPRRIFSARGLQVSDYLGVTSGTPPARLKKKAA